MLVLTGGPAAGKSSTARALAETVERCAVIDVDDLRQLIVQGHAAPWEGAAGHGQQQLGVRNACMLARNFVDEGYAVIVADVLTPATTSVYRGLLGDVMIVQLTLSYEEALRRASLRPVHLTPAEFDDLHAAQTLEPPTADLLLEVTSLSLAEQVETIGAVWLQGVESPTA